MAATGTLLELSFSTYICTVMYNISSSDDTQSSFLCTKRGKERVHASRVGGLERFATWGFHSEAGKYCWIIYKSIVFLNWLFLHNEQRRSVEFWIITLIVKCLLIDWGNYLCSGTPRPPPPPTPGLSEVNAAPPPPLVFASKSLVFLFCLNFLIAISHKINLIYFKKKHGNN